MEILSLAQKSLNKLKSDYQLPKSGFIAGGSLANLIWQEVSGINAVINDIDVYVFEKEIQGYESELRENMHFVHKEKYLYDDYRGAVQHYRTKEFYTIDHVERDGMINTIFYNSISKCPSTILKSFDINCCQVGYDIESDKFYWTHQFEDFIKTGKLQIVNLTSPAHTAIRLIKKQDELKADIDPIDFDMIEYTLESKRFIDVSKIRFKDRYAEMFNKYKDELEKRFELTRDSEIETWLFESSGLQENIWRLKRKSEVNPFDKDLNIGSIMSSIDFIFYTRNIFKTRYEKIWYHINHLFSSESRLSDYLDTEISTIDMELLHNLITASPNSVNNLKGLSLSKQLSILKKLLLKYQDDPIVALSILEAYKVDDIEKQDDFGMLLLELSVRRNVIDDPRGKIVKLFHNLDKQKLFI